MTTENQAPDPAQQWTANIAGPDDVHRFDTELAALRFANQVNRTYLADLLAHPGDEVLCLATVSDASPPLAAPARASSGVPMCSEQAVLHALTMARGEAHQQGDAALWQAFGRAMWRQFNAMAASGGDEALLTAMHKLEDAYFKRGLPAFETAAEHIEHAASLIQASEGAQVTDDMRSAVRWAPSSAYWSERLREFFGPDAREGIDALERQLRAALAAPAPQAAPRAWLITADDDGSADWVELGAAQPEPVEGFRAVPLGPLAALQAAPVALTDEQIAAGWKAWPEQAITSAAKAVRFVRSLGIPALQTKEPTNDR